MAKQTEPKRWRVRGVADDGVTVTLGRYETEKQAKADADRLTKEGMYTDLSIEAIEVPPAEEPE